MKKILLLILGTLLLLLTACNGTPATATSFSPPAPTLPSPTQPATVTPSLTFTPAPSATFTSSPIPSATWVAQGPGDVNVPILLYHHIGVSSTNNPYYVTPEKFEEQLKLLHNWGYTSITTKMLIQAIVIGVKLPPHPVLITFDDGDLDNYTTAFPIMQKYGYTGVLYLVANYIGKEGYMTVDQVLEMHNAGWELGSHSLSHHDLTKLDPDSLHNEIIGSRARLEKLLGVPIETFAYPFGFVNRSAIDYAEFAGYSGAMGANGYTSAQGTWNLYNLQRVGIKGSEDAKTFTRFLPWHGDPSYLPTDTPVP